jgi:hypothetical protein
MAPHSSTALYLNQIAHLAIEMWESWWLVEHNVLDSFYGRTPEEMKSFTIKQEVGFSMEEHVPCPGYLALLET